MTSRCISLEPNIQRCFMIAARFVEGGGPFLKFTPHGLLSLVPGGVLDAPNIRQGSVLLRDLYQATNDMDSYYNRTSIDALLLDYVRRSGGPSASGNKTFTGLTRLDGGVYTRRHIVSNTTR